MVRLPPIINHAYLMVTEFCPLRCEYCYIKDRATMNEFPYELMEKVKHMFTCFNKPRLVFFGGEPLVKVDLIKKIVENYSNDFQFQVVTNGCVNFHKFMDEVYEPNRNNFDVQISWDGNTTTRPFVNGDKTYESVYSNIIEELEKGRILVGRAVLNEESVKCFYQTFDTYRILNRKYKFGGDFTIAHQPSFKESYAKDLYDQTKMVLQSIKEDFHKDERIYVPDLLLKVITNMIEQKEVISCDIGTHVVIKPNGDIYPCTILSQQDERFKLGNLNTNVDTEIITDLRYKSKCQKDCAFKALCDGGCRYERILNFPNDWKCEVCSHTCDIYESLYNAAKEFLESLNDEENTILMKVINSYNLFKVSYDNGLEMNHNERML
jgi:uncharacterized protein